MYISTPDMSLRVDTDDESTVLIQEHDEGAAIFIRTQGTEAVQMVFTNKHKFNVE